MEINKKIVVPIYENGTYNITFRGYSIKMPKAEFCGFKEKWLCEEYDFRKVRKIWEEIENGTPRTYR